MIKAKGSGTVMMAAAVLAFAVALLWIAPGVIQAQDDSDLRCLSREQCRQLRHELERYRHQIRPLKRELRQLREQVRQLDPDDPRHAELIEQARERKQELRQLRRQRRPAAERFEAGCRPECSPS